MENTASNIVLIGTKTGDVYKHLADFKFLNLTTGKEGELTRDQVQNRLAFPVRLNEMIATNPSILIMIEKFGLTVIND